jgi:antitoxin component YwqK of YwqJK toxin-antitoxin module
MFPNKKKVEKSIFAKISFLETVWRAYYPNKKVKNLLGD